jgi:hypothetical protein
MWFMGWAALHVRSEQSPSSSITYISWESLVYFLANDKGTLFFSNMPRPSLSLDIWNETSRCINKD